MFIRVQVFDDHDRTFRPHDLKQENVQAIGPLELLPSLKDPAGLAVRKVQLLTGLWFYVKDTDCAQLKDGGT